MRKAYRLLPALFTHKKTSLFLFSLLIAAAASGQSWQQRGSDINGKNNMEGIGNATSLSWDGKLLAIGAGSANSLSGVARVYEWSGSAWTQKGSDLKGATGTQDQFGWSVSLDSSGKTLAVGAPYADGSFGQFSNSGYVKIYSWSGTAWVQKGSDIAASSSGENCGYYVSLSRDGNTIAIGAAGNAGGGSGRGQVRIYSWSGSAWTQKGGNINGEADYDVFGNSVSLDGAGNKVAIGAPLNSGNGTSAGHARVYGWSGSAWVQLGGDFDGDTDSDNLGYSVSLSKNGLRLAVGAPQDFGGGYGYARIFDMNPADSTWAQKGSDITTTIDGDEFGHDISLSGNGDYIAIGGRQGATGNEKGRAEVYNWSSSAWTQVGSTIKGSEDYAAFGHSVTMNYTGDVFATSAPSYNGSGSAVGIVQVYKFAGPCTPTSSTTTISACNSYTWNSKIYDTSGTYKETIMNAEGCDSVMTLNLTILKAELKTLASAICGNEPYIAPSGKKYTTSGTHEDTLKRKAGCDSIVYTITLTKKIPNVDGFVLEDSTMTAVSEGAVAHGDVDNDGDIDILISGKDASYDLKAEIYTNDGSGNFTKMTGTNFTGAVYGSASLVDVNGDDIPEVFITGIDKSNNRVSYLYQYYQGTYLHVTSAPFGTLTGTKHAFADADNDADPDLFISSGDSVLLYENTGGDFAATPDVITNSKADNGFILAGDVSGDGYVDIIKSGSDLLKGAIPTELFINDKTGGFTKVSDPFNDLLLSAGALADLNNDGKTDFIMTGMQGWSMVTNIYTNNGTGVFTKADSTSIKGFAYGSLTVEDFNSDGKQDVLISGNPDFAAPQTRLYIKDANKGYVIASKLPVQGLQMSAATSFDIDNDGIKDLLITGQSSTPATVTKLFKNKGCFAPCETESEIDIKNCGPYTSPSGKYVWSESGTYTDVLKNKAGCDSTITIHLKTSSYSSFLAVACDSFITPRGRVVHTSGKYVDTLGNQWGCDSIITINLTISSTKVSFYSFSEFPGVKLLDLDRAADIADINGDGKPDILEMGQDEGNQNYRVKLYKNDGGGKFSEITGTNLEGYGQGTVVIKDVDGDGKPDVLVTGFAYPNSFARLYKNDGSGVFSEFPGASFIGASVSATAIEDVDGDGKPEIFIAGNGKVNGVYTKACKLYKNNGGGNFSEYPGTSFPGYIYGAVTIKDVDGDGKPEILIAGRTNSGPITELYKNNGSGNFSKYPGVNLPGVGYSAVAIEDMDGDGKQDILISGQTASGSTITKLYKNNGSGNFTEFSGANMTGISDASAAIADLDGNGTPDILIMGDIAGNRLAKLYSNQGSGNFIEVTGHNMDGYIEGHVVIADVDADSKPDVLLTGRKKGYNKFTRLYKNMSGQAKVACIAPTGCNTYTSPSGKYNWTKSGVYKDTIKLAGYDSVITVNLLIDSLEAKFSQKTDATGEYDVLIVNKSKGINKSFVWHFGDGDSSTEVKPTHTYKNSGTYTLCLTVRTKAGCMQKYCEDITFHGKTDAEFKLGIVDSSEGTMATFVTEEPKADLLSFSIYPNPATHTLNVVNNESGDFDVTLRDLSGRQIMSLQNQHGKSRLDMSALKGGMYLIEIQSKKTVGYYKVLKQ